MTKLQELIFIGLTAAGLSLAVSAVSANQGECRDRGFNKEKFIEHMQQREARLHAQLNLSAAQESDWKTFIEKIKPAAGEIPHHEELAGLKAPERMERIAERMQRRGARMTERVAAVTVFYAVLTPAQRKVFDDNFMSHDKRAEHRG